ncbi:hypothetical protein QYM36_016614 [Artemia franciscana]|uniref:C2H2-type domain-containing protein n=1 Tax=Artemia franciscana TaxID=6661 RepID=A0AA88HB93_ARTSF|nr:hypothetical protein QYM36_016614 [Artemia franciscana]
MFGSQMATASSAKSPKAAGSVPIPIQSSSTANQSSAAAANSGLKMKFKRTKPSPGTRGTEGKLEIVKNADQSHSGILQQQGVDKNRLPPLKKPTTPVVTPQTKKEKGKESPVKTEGRPQFPVNPPIVKVAPTVQQPSVRMPNSVNTTKPVVPVTPTPNCSVLAPVEQKVVAVSQEVLSLNELDESLVKKPKLKRLLSDQRVDVFRIGFKGILLVVLIAGFDNPGKLYLQGNQPKSPTNESANNQSEASPSVLLQKTDICVGTSVGTMTEPECLGPCEPGTAVTLEGIVWHESEGGVLVVNVTWRGKTYVGTLMDCTRHQWAPPRFCESPQEDLDTRGKPRPKRLRGNGLSTPQEQANSSLYAKLRTTVKGRVTRTATNSGSPLKSEQNGTKRKGTKDIEANNNANKRSRSNSRGPDTTSPSVTTETAPPVCTSPLLLECPVPNCSKKYKHANGLKFHQDHAHNGDEVEQAKCDSEVESVLDSASRRSTPVISDRKDIEVPAESSESEKPLEMNVEIGADSKTIIPQLPILAAVLEENKSSRAASGSPVSKVPADPLASGSSPAVLSTTVVPAMPVLVGVQEQDTLQEEENELLENKQVPEKPPEVLGPSEPPVLATSAQQPPLSEDGTREDVKSPAYSDISDPNDQAPSIDPEFMETVNKFEEPTEPIRNFGMYSVFNHQTPFLVENSKPEPSAPKPDSWVQERKAELVKEIPKEDSFVSVTNAQYFQPLFIPPEFPPRGIGQQNNESGQYATDKRPQIPSGDLKLQSEVSRDLSLKDVGIPLSLGPPLPNPLTHVQNMVKRQEELARVQHSMDFLQHHAQHQFYPMNPPHSQSSINLSNSHKIHELSERAMKSPNTSNSVPKEVPSYHSQSPSDRVMPPSSLPQSAKPQMPPPGSSPFMMGGGLGFPPHQFVPTSMSGAPSPFTPGKPIFRP